MDSKRKQHYTSLTVISVGFSMIILVKGKLWFFAILIPLIALAILVPAMAQFIHWLWYKLAWLLSLIIPKIVLTVLFYFFLWPMAILSRLFSKNDTLMLNKNRTTTFAETNKTFETNSFEKPW